MQFFSAHFRFVRHDERGCGMSEWNDRQLTVEQWTEDLEVDHRCRATGGAGHAARHLTRRGRLHHATRSATRNASPG